MRPRPHSPTERRGQGLDRPTLRLFTSTLWEYPSQHYDESQTAPPSPRLEKLATPAAKRALIEQLAAERRTLTMQGDKGYIGATPSWVVWQLLQRYTREGDIVLDPMCGSGTTLDVCADLLRKGLGFDLNPQRDDIDFADARRLPIQNDSVDFVFIDPPYSTHVDYSDDPACIGKLDAGAPFSIVPPTGAKSGGGGGGGKGAHVQAKGGKHHAPVSHGAPSGPMPMGTAAAPNEYYHAMGEVIKQAHRVLKNRRYMALYVSDSFKKGKEGSGGAADRFMPIGFELFTMMRKLFRPVDIVTVVRHNQKLGRGNWHKAAEEGNYFLRGFNYLFIMKKEEREAPPPPPPHAPARPHGRG